MAINKAMRAALKALSYPDPEIAKTYKLVRTLENVTARKVIKPRLIRIVNDIIKSPEHDIPVRIFSHERELPIGLILFFHGGGWVSGNINSYTNVCIDMVRETKMTVLSVDYRLAPEFRFPTALNDCYNAARALFLERYMPDFSPNDIIIMGDSAGGNLAAAVSLMARDRGEFLPKTQILIYPALGNNHSPDSPFESIRTNGFDYLLTSKKVEGYMQLYVRSSADLLNPYLSPLLSHDLTNQPQTLVITGEYCPLRDEGEEYAKRLAADGNYVKAYRMKDALHGYFSLPRSFSLVRQTYTLINRFIKEIRDE